jgi:ribosome-associated protein
MNVIEYALTHASLDYVELNHLLKLTGFADSGGSGGALVTTGVVKVDGQVELRKRNKIRVGQVVHIDDTEIRVVANADGDAALPTKPAKVAKVAEAAAGSKPAPKGVAQRRRPRAGAAPRGGAPRAGASGGKPSGKPTTGKPTTPRAKSK